MRRTSDVKSASLGLERLESRETPTVLGGVDPSFGTGGTVVDGFDGAPRDVAVDSQGRVVVAGRTGAIGIPIGAADFLITRYLPSGALDTSFGTAGHVQIDFSNVFGKSDDRAHAVAIGADDGIVAVGVTSSGPGAGFRFAVAKMLSTGALDTSFNPMGVTTQPGTLRIAAGAGFGFGPGFSGSENAMDVAIDSGGRIVVAGRRVPTVGNQQIAVTRLLPDANGDPTFGVAGRQVYNVSGTSSDGAESVKLTTGNKILLAGSSTNGGTERFAVFRLLESGTQDTTFGTNGVANIPSFTGADSGYRVDADAAGRPVVTGLLGTTTVGVVKLTLAGNLDSSFGTNGLFTMAGGAQSAATPPNIDLGVYVQPSGRIIVSSPVPVAAGDNALSVVRLLPEGVLDPTFNGGQTVFDPYPGDNDVVVGRIGVYKNGRIVIAGRTISDPTLSLTRLIGTVERPRGLAVGGNTTVGGPVDTFAPNPGTGLYGNLGEARNPFPGFTGTVRSAMGDVNGDGIEDTVMVTGPGTLTRYAVIDGRFRSTVLIQPTDPFGDPEFSGGAFVTTGDLDNDGRAEWVISPDQRGGPRVVVFSQTASGPTIRANFLGINDPAFRGGARVAVGDLNGDGYADVAVAAGFLGGPRVAVFDGRTVFNQGGPTQLIGDFFAFDGKDAQSLRNGVFVALSDVNGDGFADLVVGGGPGGAPRVMVLSGQLLLNGIGFATAAPVANFFVNGDATNRGGVRVTAVDLDGDNKADVAVGSGEGQPSKVRVYWGATFVPGGEPTGANDLDPFNGVTLPGGIFVG